MLAGGGAVAVDASKTAIHIALERWPGIEFRVYDILSMPAVGKYELVVMAETLWYLVEDLGVVFEKIRKMLVPFSGIIAIKQYFPAEQSYFKDLLDGEKSFEKALGRHGFNIVDYASVRADDGNVICLTAKL